MQHDENQLYLANYSKCLAKNI